MTTHGRLPGFALLALLSIAAASTECYVGCNFRPCWKQTKFNMKQTHKDVPFTGEICHKNGTHIGEITASGQPYIIRRLTTSPYIEFTHITQFKPEGIWTPFEWDFFKFAPKYIPAGEDEDGKPLWHRTGRSAIVRRAFRTNQRDFIHNKCIILPIRSYELHEDTDMDEDDVKSVYTRQGRDCVAFYVTNH